MEVVVQVNHSLLTQEQKPLVESRVRAATQRMSGLLSRAVVRLTDINGPRGGVDKQCQIQFSTATGSVLVVSSRGSDWRATLEEALARATHTLSRRYNARKTKAAAKPGALAIHRSDMAWA